MIGIDLGTTNSCAAIMNAFGEVEAVAVATGTRPPYDTVLRTAVLNPEGSSPQIGEDAVIQASTRLRPEDRYLSSFKPHLDEQQLRTRRTVTVSLGSVFDPVTESETERTAQQETWVGGEFTRSELIRASTHILSRLVQQAIAAGGDPSQLWVGMPVTFSGCARKRLIAALRNGRDERGRELFGEYGDLLRRVRFVLEPVAVAAGPMREAIGFHERENVLVFDHGGGTLDLSLIAFERRPGFDHPVPTRELAAFGSREVAGRAIDLRFRRYLNEQPDFAQETRGRREHIVDAFVEECKQRLSTASESEAWPGVLIARDQFEQAIRPILDDIEGVVRQTLRNAELVPHDVHRVVMTGGSSLVPAVQRRVADVFAHLDEYQLLTYDPNDCDGVEGAITEVAKGLVAFGDQVAQQGVFEQIVLWDVGLCVGGRKGARQVAKRGEAYPRGRDGSLSLKKTIEIKPTPGEGTSFGLYEDQLGPRFMFGLADVPPLPAGGTLEITLRPETLMPGLRFVGPSGKSAVREAVVDQRGSASTVEADLLAMSETQLEEYFDDDADYHPINGYRRFECSPLVRRLKKGDLVEWACDADDAGPGRDVIRLRGEIVSIRDMETNEQVDEMTTWELSEFQFRLREKGSATVHRVSGRNGSMRLAPRPWRDY